MSSPVGHNGALTFDQLSLPAERVPVASKQEHRRIGTFLQHHSRVGFQQPSQPAECHVAGLFAHLRELVRELFGPRPLRLEQSTRFRQPVSYNRLINQRTPKSLALQHVLESCRKSNTRLPRHVDGYREALMVEVGHDVLHALVR